MLLGRPALAQKPCVPGWVGASQLLGARRKVANLEIVCEGSILVIAMIA